MAVISRSFGEGTGCLNSNNLLFLRIISILMSICQPLITYVLSSLLNLVEYKWKTHSNIILARNMQ